MAAKVVMVAVPTVLGIASFRVYTVNEVPAEGLVSREKLNIYTSLPKSAQTKFVPESPGSIERGLTTTRESLVPLLRAVKDTCVSVKRGSLNLYHAGEDVYYYLVDPPPGFLPRFGTITMAGLLGMFLARRGSRFKRLAVPLGLMSAGASVCYPAQAVAVLKVTGRKVYAAGQWSSAAVSSLFTSKKPVATEIAASQPQSATEPNRVSAPLDEASVPSSTDPSSQSSASSETEVESAECDLISHESAVTATTKEESSITVTEITPDHTPETDSDDTKTSPPSEDLAAPAGSSESLDSKQAADDVSTDTRPDKPTPSLEAETIEDIPAESASAKSADTESTPSSEVTSAPEASDMPAAPVVEPVAAAEPDQQSAPTVEETTTPTLTPSPPAPPPPPPSPPPQQPAEGNTKEGSGFKPNTALMDFGQSNPEDEDLYSTRS